MLITKKITLFKYLNSSNLNLINYTNYIQTVYRLDSNRYYKWDADYYALGLSQDFEQLEYKKGYIIVSKNYPYLIDNGSQAQPEECVVQEKQISPYNGGILDIFRFSQLYGIKKVYKLNDNGNLYIKWDKDYINIGLQPDFEFFENGNIYLIIGDEVSYILWPPLNFNKSTNISNYHINWGLKDHT